MSEKFTQTHTPTTELEACRYAPNINALKKYIFVHNPRTAGTSFQRMLRHTASTHFRAIDYRAALGKEYREYFSFCVVRNPWDRFLSNYEYARMPRSYHHDNESAELAPYGRHPDYELVRTLTIAGCARLLAPSRKSQMRRRLYSLHWAQQWGWFADSGGESLVDFIGRYEDLEGVIGHIGAALASELQLPRLNASPRAFGRYRDVMDQETIDLVANFYRRDIELLGYSY